MNDPSSRSSPPPSGNGPPYRSRRSSLVDSAPRENEEPFRTIFEQGSFGMVTVDEKFAFLRANAAFCSLLGYSEQELVSRTFKDVTHPDHLDEDVKNVRRLFKGEIPVYKTEKRYVRKDGAVVWGAVTVNVMRNNQGTFLYFLTMVEDITQRKAAERSLAEALEMNRHVIESSLFGMMLFEAESGRCVLANQAMADIVGTTLEVEYSQNFRKMPPWKETGLLDMAEKVIATGTPARSVIFIKTMFGKEVWMDAILSRVPTQGRPHLLFMCEDITERKNAEDALLAEKERLGVTLRSIGDGVIATDINGVIVLMNKVAEDLTGFGAAEAVGRTLTDIFHIINEDTKEACTNPVQKVLATGGIVGLANHTTLIGRNGAERAIADSGAPIRDKNSVIVGVVLVFRDITEKLKAESALRNVEKLESIGMLAGGIAHDFNNLLSGLFGYLDLARGTIKKNDRAVGYLDKAFSVFGRAKDLTGQLLTFAKGGAPLKKDCLLAPLVRDAVHFALSGSVVKVRFEIADDLWRCDVDENQISQVLDNIVINARDAMPAGGEIMILAVNIPAGAKLPPDLMSGRRYVRITVRDKGIGIAPEHLPRIFDPFFTTKQKGSGLGLATSYSIVKRHEGAIEAESTLGKGATFSIYLPASDQSGAETASFTQEPVKQAAGRVLLMDDEDFILDTASAMLQNLGLSVETAASGEEAVDKFNTAKLKSRTFDLVILDLTIPGGMGGRETGERILMIDPSARILASSGYSEDPVMAHPERFGFMASLDKPYRGGDLARAVAKAMKTAS